MNVKFEYVKTNGIRLRVALAGDPAGTPVFLLHGFPDAWFGWEPQIAALAAAGFRVIAPDQRGYNLSEKPAGVEAYHLDELTADIIGLADHFGYEQFNLAGHDWGASVAWWLAQHFPQRVRRLVICNVPHASVMLKQWRSDPGQLFKSWYMFAFQLPKLPEAGAKFGNWKPFLDQMPTMTEAEKQRYRDAWAQPGAMTGMINWYRAIMRLRPVPKSTRVKPPTLIIWGKQDAYLKHDMAGKSLRYCDDGRLVMIDDATHWVMQDAPEQVNDLLIEHFG